LIEVEKGKRCEEEKTIKKMEKNVDLFESTSLPFFINQGIKVFFFLGCSKKTKKKLDFDFFF